MKVCSKCKEEKELSEFYKSKKGKGGLRSDCKSCEKEYRENNKEKIKEYWKEYRENNKEKIKEWKENNKEKNKEYYKEYRKEYYENNKEYYKEKRKEYWKEYNKNNKEKIKEYRENNKEKIKESWKEYYENNKEKINEYHKEWRENNKEKINEYRKEYYEKNKEKINEYKTNKKQTNPLFKLRINISSLILSSIKKQGYTKRSQTYNILGCTYEEFKKHLENQFTKGMSWENQGEWHLDHIYPVSLAKDEEELYKLNHYTNFQPLWAEDNLKKGNKVIEQQLKLL